MTDVVTPRRRRRFWTYILFLMLTVVFVLAGAAWYMTTDSFQSLMLRRIVAELERITGGQVEIQSLHTVPFRLQVEMRGLTIHGREPAGEVPYVQVDSLSARVKIISLLETQFGFDFVILDRPVVHIAVYPDGSTNQPQPHLAQSGGETPVERLFALSIESFQVRHGDLLLADQKMPLDFTLHDVAADMSYSLLHRRYEANVLLGKGDTSLFGYRPVAWTAEIHFNLARDSAEVKSFQMTSGRSRLAASGRIANFRQPRIEGDYDATLDLVEAAAIVRRPEVRRGIARAAGHGSWSVQDFASAGQITLKDFDWRTLPVGLHDVNVDTRFALDQKHLSLSQIQARVFGGSVTGDADFTGSGWLDALTSNTPKKSAKAGLQEEPKGSAKLRLRDLKASEIAGAFFPPGSAHSTASTSLLRPAEPWKLVGEAHPATPKLP